MVETLNHWTAVAQSMVSFGWELVILLSILSLISFMMRNTLTGRKKKTGPKFGMLQVNRGVTYERKPALENRRRQGLTTAEEAEAEAPQAAAAAVEASETESAASGADSSCCAGETTDVEALYRNALASVKPVAVIRITNDVMASQRHLFAKLVDEVIANRQRFSRVIVVADSPGGGASQYGHMLYEMTRLRRCSGLHITACVDTVAASGGMLQILPAHQIIAVPWSMIGSIGVVTEFLNFNKLLATVGVTPIEVTAGKFKRTLTMFGEVTDDKKKHMEQQLAAIHQQFIGAVKQFRPHVDVDKVCNGDHWSAQQVFDEKLGLIDRLGSSQEVLFEANQAHDLIMLSENANPWEKGIFRFITKLADHVIYRLTAGPFGRVD